MTNKPVFSTDKSQPLHENKTNSSGISSSGPLKIRLEKKSRAGKVVTVLFELPFSSTEAKKHKKALSTKIGTGATLKSNTIELQGDRRDDVESYFSSVGIKTLRAGG